MLRVVKVNETSCVGCERNHRKCQKERKKGGNEKNDSCFGHRYIRHILKTERKGASCKKEWEALNWSMQPEFYPQINATLFLFFKKRALSF